VATSVKTGHWNGLLCSVGECELSKHQWPCLEDIKHDVIFTMWRLTTFTAFTYHLSQHTPSSNNNTLS